MKSTHLRITFVLATVVTLFLSQPIEAQYYGGMGRGGMRMGMNRGMNRSMVQGNMQGKQHERFDARLKELTDTLHLTSDQQSKVKDIMKQTRAEAKTIIQNNQTKEDRRPNMMDLAKRTDSQINALLDPKQQEIYKNYKASQKANRKNQMNQQKEMRMEMDDAGIL